MSHSYYSAPILMHNGILGAAPPLASQLKNTVDGERGLSKKSDLYPLASKAVMSSEKYGSRDVVCGLSKVPQC